MGAKGEAFAKQFEAKAQEVSSTIERLSDADWKKVTAAEKWSVGVVAHHIAGSHQGLSGVVKMLADQSADDGIANQFSGVHHRLGLQTDWSALGDSGAKHVARRQLDHPAFCLQARCLGAFAGPWRPEKDDVDHRPRSNSSACVRS